jgi:iron(III) transport system substrate-binding protein
LGMSEENPETKTKDHWFRDMMVCINRGNSVYGLLLFTSLIGLLFIAFLFLESRHDGQRVVVIYTSQDQVYAEPILKEFEQQTGIEVRAVYDSEAVKTVGLVNRLIAEKDRPQCDIFWNNEELRTRQLAALGVFEKWAAVGHRSRRIAVNTNKVSLAAAPHSLTELTNETWRGKVALAYPLFGTTAAHFLSLRQNWGDERWQNWCRALAANKPFLVDGNSVSAKLVAKGEAWVGLTDSDDIAAEQREGASIVPLPLTEESLLIPNTVAVVRSTRHQQAAEKLFAYLQRPDVLEKLVAADALENASTSTGPDATLKPDWDRLLTDLEVGMIALKQFFLR